MENEVTSPSAEGAETVESIAEDISKSVTPLVDYMSDLTARLAEQFSGFDGLVTLLVLLATALIGWLIQRPLNKLIEAVWPTVDGRRAYLGNLKHVFKRVAVPLILVAILWVSARVLHDQGVSNEVLRVIASLLQAWVVINLFSAVVRDPGLSRLFAATAWVLAALHILRLLNPLIAALDSIGIQLGAGRFSIYDGIKAMFLLALLLWTARMVVGFVQARLSRSKTLNSSIQMLIGRAVRLLTLFVAVLLALTAVGVDLTALAVFSGALGVGIGIGLQAIVANLVSGVTLLMEGSIKVGDFIVLQSGVRGEVRDISTRVTRITTNDNVDILVPNSELVNGQVINWTLRDTHCRTRIPFGVAYGTDKELVRTAALEAAAMLDHELTGPLARPAQVWLTGFGESSLDFELVLWLKHEAVKRPDAVLADYNWALETALSKYGITIPFPQRDLHLKSSDLPIKL